MTEYPAVTWKKIVGWNFLKKRGIALSRGQYDVNAVQWTSTSARNKQSIFVLLSHQKYTLNFEITGYYFSWIVDKNSKNTSQFQLVAGSPIHLLAYFSLWHIHRVQWITYLWYFWYYATVYNGSKYSPLALWKHPSSAIW